MSQQTATSSTKTTKTTTSTSTHTTTPPASTFPTTRTRDHSQSSSSLSIGPIIGAIAGGVVAVLVVIILIVRRRRNKDKELPSAVPSYQGLVAAGKEVNPKALTLMEVIDQGPFGVLTRALLKTDSASQEVAVKSLHASQHSPLEQRNSHHARVQTTPQYCCLCWPVHADISHVAHSRVLLHRHAVQLLQARMYRPFGKFIICSDRLQAQIYESSEDDLLDMAVQISRGMAHLAAQGITHGALTTKSVMLSEQRVCKITNLGQPTKESELTSSQPQPSLTDRTLLQFAYSICAGLLPRSCTERISTQSLMCGHMPSQYGKYTLAAPRRTTEVRHINSDASL